MVSRGGSSTQENDRRTDNKGEARLHMRIFGRNDAFLLGGFAIAVWVVSSHQLGTLLDRAREIDHSRGLQLVPALRALVGAGGDVTACGNRIRHTATLPGFDRYAR